MLSPFPCSAVICECFWIKITELSCASIKFRSDVINMCVVPVQIRHLDFNKVLDTHEMLDIRYHWSRNKSNSEDINGDISRDDHCGWESEDSRIIGQTEVDKATKSIQQTGSTSWRARDSNTRKSAKRNYLEGIANEIFPNTDISVGLLIGTNRAQALKPKEVIPSRESGTYAIKTILGLEREREQFLYS